MNQTHPLKSSNIKGGQSSFAGKKWEIPILVAEAFPCSMPASKSNCNVLARFWLQKHAINCGPKIISNVLACYMSCRICRLATCDVNCDALLGFA